MTFESAAFTVVYVSAVAAAWLATYWVHSTLLIVGAGMLDRLARLDRATRELVWKLAIVGGVVTATVAVASGIQPWLGRFDTAGVVEARTWGGAVTQHSIGSTEPGAERFDARIPEAFTLLRYAPLVFVMLWVIYAAAVLLRVVYETARARRSLGPRKDVSGEAREVFCVVAQAMGLRRPVRFTCSERVASPMALGRSEITVPRWLLTELDAEDQRSVMAHEVAHLVRRDPMWLLAAATMESIFFFQPLNRVARMKWQEQAEYACDELVVRLQGSGLPLARALARVAESLTSDPPRLLAPTLAEETRTLLGRVRALLQGSAPPRSPWAVRMALWVLPLVVLCASPSFAPGSVRGWGAAAFHWTGVMHTGQNIEIQGVLGNIRVETAPADSVVVHATRHGRSTDPDIHFDVVRHSKGVTICAMYPTPDSVAANVCTPGAPVQYNTRANDVEIEFVVRVPRGVNVVASTATGSITTTPLQSAVQAYSLSGDIDIATSEHASAESKSGDIRVAMGRADWDGTASLATLAGNIWVTLPESSSVDVDAQTHTGTIRSDFDIGQERPSWWSRLKLRGSLGTSAHGAIGSGAHRLELSTQSGNIVIKRH
jgi:Zn-dependent protease with chaperone function